MTATNSTNDQGINANQGIPADLLTDLIDPILAHAVCYWWQAKHQELATPEDPQPPIPTPPVKILRTVPRALAPSATLAALAPFVASPPQWSNMDRRRQICPGTASSQGKVWMLDALVKLYHLGRLPPGVAKTDSVLDLPSDEAAVQGDQVEADANEAGQDGVGGADEETGENNDSDLDSEDDLYGDSDVDDEDVGESNLEYPYPWLLESKCPFIYTCQAINTASANNLVLVLDWWLKLHRKDPKLFPLQYTEAALDSASWAGHIQVLDWWLESGLELRYSWAALADASSAGHVHVLEWWLRAEKEGKLVRDCSARVLDRASFENRISVLDFWVDQGELPTLNDKYSDQAIAIAAARGHVDVLKWWRSKADAGVFPACAWVPEKVARSASSRVKMEVLDWMLEDGVLTEAVKKDLARKLSFADGAEFNEWKPQVREWWVKKVNVVIPAQ